MMDIRIYLERGIKELNLVPMDPYVLPEVVLSTDWMNTTFNNMRVYRMSAFEINTIQVDFDKNPFVTIDYYHPYTEIKSHYRLDGTLLKIPIHADGESEARFSE